MKVKTLLITLLCCLTLAACTTTVQTTMSDAEKDAIWSSHQKQLNTLKKFSASGSFSFISPDNKVSSSFSWQQESRDKYTIKLISPFGKILLNLDASPGLAIITDENQAQYISDNVEKLVFQLTKMQLPLVPLQQWLIGLAQSSQAITLNDSGLLEQATLNEAKAHWHVKISDYTTIQGVQLPSKLLLTRNNERLQLNITHWQLASKGTINAK